MTRKITYIAFVFFLKTAFLHAQLYEDPKGFWEIVGSQSIQGQTPANIPFESPTYARLNTESLQSYLGKLSSNAGQLTNLVENELYIPMPDGSYVKFQVQVSAIFPEGLKDKFPEILTFNAVAVDDPAITASIDLTPRGFHALIYLEDDMVYIDPLKDGVDGIYQVYFKKDYQGEGIPMMEETPLEMPGKHRLQGLTPKKSVNEEKYSTGPGLRIFRIAIAATGEYTFFHGGDKMLAMSAIATTLNRVNGIFERELAIRLMMVPQNDLLIFTEPTTDPYSNGNSLLMLNENQRVLDSLIGFNNYDLGHVFSTGSNGIAYLSSLCSQRKAGGVSSFVAPYGDPFDVDLVAHEIGHQFGANHSHNNPCNRRETSAYEPGSGSTIMGYAGLCPPNLQLNSHPYFHTYSFEEIQRLLAEKDDACASIFPTNNRPPEVSAGNGGFAIPKNTPFMLTGNATDPDGDPVTYCWEQLDLGPAGFPNEPEGNAPLFRSYPPTKSPSRTFPQLNDILANSQTIGEILPSYGRELTFRLTARDNRLGGGGVAYDEVSFFVADNAGPFKIDGPAPDKVWYAKDTMIVNWDVASTHLAPVNCQKVNILLSIDGGLTFPILLAEGVDNDGAHEVLVPEIASEKARLKVEAANNIFFAISPVDFVIIKADYELNVSNDTILACAPNISVFDIKIDTLLNFSDSVEVYFDSIPHGFATNWEIKKIKSPASFQILISDTMEMAPGVYPFELKAKSVVGNVEKSLKLYINLSNNRPEKVLLQRPEKGITGVSLNPQFIWEDPPGDIWYSFDLAEDSAFNSIIYSESGIKQGNIRPNKNLHGNKKYFWRVRGSNSCGVGPYSVTASFTTESISCDLFSAKDLPVVIPSTGTPVVYSTIFVPQYGLIQDIQLKNLKGKHSYISDLEFYLKSPEGTLLKIFGNICGNNKDFYLNFSDRATEEIISCPPVSGDTYKPIDALGSLIGEQSGGDWVLMVVDKEDQDGGSLESWELEICTTPLNFNFAAHILSTTSIDLNWNDVAENENTYVVERKLVGEEEFTEIASLVANSISYVDTELAPGTTYLYRVKVLMDDGGYAFSPEIAASTNPLPPVVAGTLAIVTASQNRVELKWENVPEHAEWVRLERSVGDSLQFAVLDTLPVSDSTYQDRDVVADMAYYYRFVLFNASGVSPYSETVKVSTPIKVPDQPTNLMLVEVGEGKAEITWEYKSEIPVTGFLVERSKDNINFNIVHTLDSGTTVFLDTTLSPLTTYFYRVRAINEGGTSLASQVISIETLQAMPKMPEIISLELEQFDRVKILWSLENLNGNKMVIERAIADPATFEAIDTVLASNTSFVDIGLKENTDYFYRLVTFNEVGSSETTPVDSIRTGFAPPIPPVDVQVEQIDEKKIKVSWKDNSTYSFGYLVERSKENEHNYKVIGETEAEVYTFIDSLIDPNVTYFYKVKAKGADGVSESSQEALITTLITSLGDIAGFSDRIEIYPNPSQGNVNVHFEQAPMRNVHISLFDQTGRLIKENEFGSHGQFHVDFPEQSPGIYFLHVSSGDKKQVFKLVKL